MIAARAARRPLARLARDRRGATLVEFAIVAPVFLTMLLGGMELGHTMYVRSVLRGQVEVAGRALTLESAANDLANGAILEQVRQNIRQVMPDARVDFEQVAYHDYTDASLRAESYIDGNHNGRCDAGETYVDANNNNAWDLDSGRIGRGGAKDVVLFTATVTYPRLPLGRLFGQGDTLRMKAGTFLRNQPSDNQADAPLRKCAG